MKSEQVRTLTQHALERLTKALDAGESETLKTFLRAAARFHRYSFRNVMLIATQCPEATRVAGFRAWKQLGRFVKKGEKGIVIVAPVPYRGSDDADCATAETDDRRESGMRFKAAYVFDVAQTDGEPLPALTRVAGDPGVYTARVKALLAAKQIALDYADDLDGAEGRSHGGRIEVLRNLTPAHEFEVLAHELAHELLHQGVAPEARPPKTVRETEAEAVAFIVCEGVGLATGTAATDYIQLYRGDAETLTRSLTRVRDAAAAILETLLPESSAEAA